MCHSNPFNSAYSRVRGKKWNTKDTSQNVFENMEVGQEEVQKARDFTGRVKSEKKGL